MIRLYNFIIFIITPIAYLYFERRKKIGKEDLKNFNQKIGVYNVSRPKKRLIWFHAVSVGETLSIIPLMNKLCETINVKIILTTSTLTSSKVIKGRLHKNIFHQFAPIDKKQYVVQFLNHFKPDIGIWVESELWPNLIHESAKRKLPMILLNARISNKTPLKRFFYKLFATQLINKFDLILPQEKRDLLRVKELTSIEAKHIGNLKLDCPPLPYNITKLRNLEKTTQSRKLFLAASTHPGEEDLISDVHHELRQNHPDLLTIIVPRHPERSEEIEYLLKEVKMLSVTIRSKNEKITNRTDIYLADTLGELGLFYRLCDIAFIGGSLVDIGGHNPIEAAKCDSAIISGNFTKNFSGLYDDLAKHKGAIIIDNIYDLEKQINQLLIDPNLLQSQISNAKTYILHRPNIIENTIAEIRKFL